MYISEQAIDTFLLNLITNQNLTNNNPNQYWKNVSLLNIQKDGESQDIMVQKFKMLVKNKLNIDIAVNDYSKHQYIYIDDFLFSGKKLQTDLITFMNLAPQNANIIAIYVGVFTSGEYYVKDRWLKENNSKNINFDIWRLYGLENKNICQNVADVLLPTSNILQFENVNQYLKEQSQYILRDISQQPNRYCEGNHIFSSEENRQIIEKEFTLAGLKINSSIRDTRKRLFWKPLGLTSFHGLGFGAMVTTYRNCPNNTPLALWWGDWNDNNTWTPLFMRKTYN